MQAGRGGGAALTMDGGVILERRGHGGISFGEASEVCCEGATGGHILRSSPLFREF